MRTLFAILMLAVAFSTVEAKNNKTTKKVEKVTLFDFQSGAVDSISAFVYDKKTKKHKIDSSLVKEMKKYVRQLAIKKYGTDQHLRIFKLFDLALMHKVIKTFSGDEIISSVPINFNAHGCKKPIYDFNEYKQLLLKEVKSLELKYMKEKNTKMVLEVKYVLNVIYNNTSALEKYFLDYHELDQYASILEMSEYYDISGLKREGRFIWVSWNSRYIPNIVNDWSLKVRAW